MAMLKTFKRKRNGDVVELEDTPVDATLRPSFTPPCTPQKRRFSCIGMRDDALNSYLDVPKRRHMAHCGALAALPRSRTEVAAALAAESAATGQIITTCAPEEAADTTGAEETKKHETTVCPHCGRAVTTPTQQGPLFTLNDVKRIVATALQEQDRKLRQEYDKMLQQKLREQYNAFMQMQAEAARPSDYSYIS